MSLFVIGFLLVFIVPCIFIYALIRPKKFNIRTKMNETGRWTTGQAFAVFMISWLVVTIMMIQGALSSSENEKTVDVVTTEAKEVVATKEVVNSDPIVSKPVVEPNLSVQEIEKPVEKPIAKQNKTFGITVPEYEKRLLALAKEVGLGDIKGKPIEVTKGEVNDTFKVMHDDGFGMVGTVDKNGEISGIICILGKTEPGSNQSTNFLLMSVMNARVLTPNTPKEEIGAAFVELVTKTVEETKKTGSSTNKKMVGDTNLTVSMNELTGLLITLSPV